MVVPMEREKVLVKVQELIKLMKNTIKTNELNTNQIKQLNNMLVNLEGVLRTDQSQLSDFP